MKCSNCDKETSILVVQQEAFIQVQWCVSCLPMALRGEVIAARARLAFAAPTIAASEALWHGSPYLEEDDIL